ncbi:uncharacterized protein N7479_001135 [Penicillium vulpinum]|uniref:Uncharacterized protein n=1 Tax=Penicillium vulpinum TaxID=29845 RepID=A0A1V6RF02_9EURO|nr:uncharacterized protein N7479_001135 [Penicillium vulpinum]KAJ5971217.1 hypothetical protein N7479_001135 [Penicillium vulpinum]OQE00216.1 hypothetical protein PENVUL_c056G09698 [Penicillium vulpinum]
MAFNHPVRENDHSSAKKDKTAHLTVLDTLAAVAVVGAEPTTTPTIDPIMETVEAIIEPVIEPMNNNAVTHTVTHTSDKWGLSHRDNNGDKPATINTNTTIKITGSDNFPSSIEKMQSASPRASVPGGAEGNSNAGSSIGEPPENADKPSETTQTACRQASPQASPSDYVGNTTATTTRRACDCPVCRTVNLHPAYFPGIPEPVLGQVWINYVDHMPGMRTNHQTQDLQRCIEDTDRISRLTNNLLTRERELLADLHRIQSETYESGDSFSEPGDPTEGSNDGPDDCRHAENEEYEEATVDDFEAAGLSWDYDGGKIARDEEIAERDGDNADTDKW